MKKLSVLLILGILLVGCSSKPKEEPVSPPETKTDYSKETNPVATITMTNGDVITAELYPEVAPNTVNNFITLANSGFYDGVIFHRVIPGFMIQGGDPDGTGMGGPGYGIKGEFANNGFPNDLKHDRGVLSMARAQDPNSAGSQFFIMHKDSPHLDKDYAAFGMVTSGLEAVDKIAALDRDRSDRPTTDSDNVIASITVDTKGVTYPAPEKN
nr:peptidylprolyl isomerase [Erysipelothrix aquatica]